MKLANLIDLNINFESKTSIKTLHQTLKNMEKDKYLTTVKAMNNIAFVRKNAKSQKISEKSVNSDKLLFEKESAETSILKTEMERPKIFLLQEGEFNGKGGESEKNMENGGDEKVGISNKAVNSNVNLKKKRLRKFSYNSVEFGKNYHLDFETTEMEDVQTILIELFNIEKMDNKIKNELEDEQDYLFYVRNYEYNIPEQNKDEDVFQKFINFTSKL